MRIALFSDIHANLPALEGYFADVRHRQVDVMYCLGDLVGYNIWPNEVIASIRDKKIPVIAGNYDAGIGINSEECGCAYKTQEEMDMGKISVSYTNSITQNEERKYLAALPSHINIRYKTVAQEINLLLVHGSPRKINEYLFEDRDEKSLKRILEDAHADICCFGHTHKPYHRIVPTGENYFRHAINIGSIGKSKDRDPRGCYVVLSIDENSSVKDKDSIIVEFIRFEYDVEKAAVAIENSLLPNEYADMLRKGY